MRGPSVPPAISSQQVPYRYVRNPLYLGNFLLSLGVLPRRECLLAGRRICYRLFLPISFDYCGRGNLFAGILPVRSIGHTERGCLALFLNFIPIPNPLPTIFPWTRAIKSEKRTLTAICLRHRIDFRKTNR